MANMKILMIAFFIFFGFLLLRNIPIALTDSEMNIITLVFSGVSCIVLFNVIFNEIKK